MRRWLLLLALPALPALAGFRLARAVGADMSPSIRPGDWLLLGPGAPERGDVWTLADPADPDRVVLRRLLGIAGDTVHWRDGRFALDGAAARLQDMGRDDQGAVYSEANQWLISLRQAPTPLEVGPLIVPAGRAWLMADGRDTAVDSRWWGSVPVAALRSEVWLRLGSSDEWRGHLSASAIDGPWYTPPPGPIEAADRGEAERGG